MQKTIFHSCLSFAPVPFLRTAVVLLLTLVAAATRAEESAPLADAAQVSRSLRLGLILSLTGSHAEGGERIRRAIELAVKTHSSPEFPITVMLEDDRSVPEQAAMAAKKLREERVDAIIGAMSVETTDAVLREAGQIPVLSPTVFPELLKPTAPNHFSNSISASALIEPIVEYLETTNPKRPAMIVEANGWGRAQRTAVENLLKAQKSKAVVVVAGKNPSELVAALRKRKSDGVLLLLERENLRRVLKELTAQKWQGGVFSSTPIFDLWKDSQDKLPFNGACFSYPFEQLAREKDFVLRYGEAFGEEPLESVDSAYDAVVILKGASLLGGNITDSLRRFSFDGVVGTYRYDPQRSLSLGESSLVCIVNKRPIVLQQRSKIRR